MVSNSGSVAGIQNWRGSAKFLISAFWCLLQTACFGTALPFFPAVKQQAQLLSIFKLSWNLWLTTDLKTSSSFPPLFRLLRTCTSYASLSFWLFLLLGVRGKYEESYLRKKNGVNNKKFSSKLQIFSSKTQTRCSDCNGHRSLIFPCYVYSSWSCREKEVF